MRIPYYWAVPEESFNWVVRQPAQKGSNEAAIESHLVQYAICIPSRLVVGVAKTALITSGVPTPEELLSRLVTASGVTTTSGAFTVVSAANEQRA